MYFLLEQETSTDLYFIKLHAPLDILQTKAEDIKLKLPFSFLSKNPELDVAIACLPFTTRNDAISVHSHRYFLLTPFVKKYTEKFFAKGDCFSVLDRIAVVERILSEARFSKREFGVKRLVNQQVFKAVYPPHESAKDVLVNCKRGSLVNMNQDHRTTYVGPVYTGKFSLDTKISFVLNPLVVHGELTKRRKIVCPRKNFLSGNRPPLKVKFLVQLFPFALKLLSASIGN